MHRRDFASAGAAMLLGAGTSVAQGESPGSYPSKPVRVVIGFSAGGSTDILMRKLAEKLTEKWGQPLVMDNKPGAGGNIGADTVAKAAPDGYTVMMGSVGPLAINATLYAKIPYDNLKDFAPISLVAVVPNVLVVHPSVSANTFPEFLALAKANPGKYFYASTGTGTAAHLTGVMLNMRAGIELVHVPYRGAVWLNDVLTGQQVQMSFATAPSVVQHIRGGRLRALAVNTPQRTAALPEVPTIAEHGMPGFDASAWFALVAPAGTPRGIVEKFSASVREALADPALKNWMVEQGADAAGNTPDQLAAFIRTETEKWASVVRASGAKAE
jgi:tripartite-type tricarboxylate transporter receptor subunit TctC